MDREPAVVPEPSAPARRPTVTLRWVLAWVLFLAVLAGFFVLGGEIDALAHLEGKTRLAAAVTSALLLASDIALPVPSSLVMTWNGSLFATLPGAAVSMTGLLAGALLGYAVARRYGKRFIAAIGAERAQAAVGPFFTRYGMLAILITRPIPLVAETVTCMAGAADMRFGPFLLGQVLGNSPLALGYAWIGASARQAHWMPVAGVLAVAIPAALLLVWRAGKRG